MDEPIKISVSFASDEALSAWYAEYLVSGSAPLVTTEKLAPGNELKLLASAAEAGPFKLAAQVLGAWSPPPDPGGFRVTLDAKSDLREHLSRYALSRRSGRMLSADPGRRSHPRFETFLRARFRSFQHLMDEYVTNISHGGVFIRTTQPPAMGTSVCVAITFPGEGEPRDLRGEVVRVVTPEEAARTGISPGIGVAFEKQETSFALAIERLLTSYLARSPRLLVVDDAEFFRRMLTDHLLELGYEVLGAPEGRTAARMLAEHLYELDGVLLDLEMPGLNGWELLDRIRKLKREASFRVVVVSGRPEEDLALLRAGGSADDAISKLMPFPELLSRVRAALGPRRP